MPPHGGGLDAHEQGMSEAPDLLPDQGGQLPTDRDAAVLEACYNAAGDVMATASSSGVVQVWAAAQGGWRILHTEKLPASQPTQLAWAHPQYGQLLAVGTSSGKVHLIQGPAPSSIQGHKAAWSSTTQLPCGKGAVSALAFAPHQHGLVLAAASSRQQPGSGSRTGGSSSSVQLWEAGSKAGSSTQWTVVSKIELPAAAGSCHCLAWHDSTPGLPPLLLGGHDAGGSIWGYSSPTLTWQELASFAAPGGAGPAAVSVHWAPVLGRPYELIAASFGATVVLYKVQQARSSGGATAAAAALERPWQLERLEVVEVQQLPHPAPVWRLQFSMVGTTLAASLDGRPEVWLWMPMLDGCWTAVSKIGAQQEQEQQQAGSGLGGGADSVMVD